MGFTLSCSYSVSDLNFRVGMISSTMFTFVRGDSFKEPGTSSKASRLKDKRSVFAWGWGSQVRKAFE